MTFAISPTGSDIQKVLGDFLLDVLPTGVEVIEGQDNQVPEPRAGNFVVMWPTRLPPISTNFDDQIDTLVTASIAAGVMTVSAIASGALRVGALLFGPNLAAGTKVDTFGTGTGGVGTYNVSPAQTAASGPVSAGVVDTLMPCEVVYQLDVHADALTLGTDMARTIVSMLRGPYAVKFFTDAQPAVSPLYAGEPRQIPFTNGERQFEWRWVIEAVLQANQTITGQPQQFADAVTVSTIEVDTAYPL